MSDIDAKNGAHRQGLRPIHRSSYGPHPLLGAFAVTVGSAIALTGTLLFQTSVGAQVAPATVRTAINVDSTNVSASTASGLQSPLNPIARVEAGKPSATPQGAIGAGSVSASDGSSTVRVAAPTLPAAVAKGTGAVLATGIGPLATRGDIASVQLASLIKGMPDGDLGQLVLASGAITLNAQARDDISNARVDQRILAMLLAVSFDHEIEVTVLRSGHSRFVKGTQRLSNHISGRAVDIGAVDGRLVRQSNKAARAILDQLLALPEPIRPTEIGSPWNTDDPETFTDSGHDDHLHIGFDR